MTHTRFDATHELLKAMSQNKGKLAEAEAEKAGLTILAQATKADLNETQVVAKAEKLRDLTPDQQPAGGLNPSEVVAESFPSVGVGDIGTPNGVNELLSGFSPGGATGDSTTADATALGTQ